MASDFSPWLVDPVAFGMVARLGDRESFLLHGSQEAKRKGGAGVLTYPYQL